MAKPGATIDFTKKDGRLGTGSLSGQEKADCSSANPRRPYKDNEYRKQERRFCRKKTK
jgi:hypothetical protein